MQRQTVNTAIADAQKQNDRTMLALLELELIKKSARKKSDTAKDLLNRVLERYGAVSPNIKAAILQATGDVYFFTYNKNSISFEYYLKAYNIYKHLSSDEFPEKGEALYNLAGAYYRYDDDRNTIRFMKQSLEADVVPGHDVTTSTYNTIGLCYQRLGEFDSSLHYFQLAMQHAIDDNQKVWIGIISGNIGRTYFRLGEIDKAIALLEENVASSLTTTEGKNTFSAICALTGYYIIKGDVATARKTWNKAGTVSNAAHIMKDYGIATLYYRTASALYKAEGDAAKAILYADSAMNAKDSATAAKIATNNIMAQEKVAYVQRRLELDRVLAEKERYIFIRNSLILTIALFTIIGLLLISRNRARQKQLAAELNAATVKLINYNRNIEALQEQVQTADDMKQEEAETYDSEIIAQLENSVLLTDEQWDEFRKLFEKVHKGFFSNLRRKLPDLTPAEVRFMALSKLQLSPKEMASMLGVSPNTIRIYKYRIRKKLNLDKDDSFEQLLQD